MLTKKAKYALNALTFIAKNSDKKVLRAEEISFQNHIPRKFLESILTDLTKVGILGSKKGKSGGYYFLKNPDEVMLVDVIRLFDGAIGLIPCVTFQYFEPCEECVDPDTCKIRWTFKELRDLTVEYLKGKSILDLLGDIS